MPSRTHPYIDIPRHRRIRWFDVDLRRNASQLLEALPESSDLPGGDWTCRFERIQRVGSSDPAKALDRRAREAKRASASRVFQRDGVESGIFVQVATWATEDDADEFVRSPRMFKDPFFSGSTIAQREVNAMTVLPMCHVKLAWETDVATPKGNGFNRLGLGSLGVAVIYIHANGFSSTLTWEEITAVVQHIAVRLPRELLPAVR
jgi:hypothetical protein